MLPGAAIAAGAAALSRTLINTMKTVPSCFLPQALASKVAKLLFDSGGPHC
jgi:hypothetical protein